MRKVVNKKKALELIGGTYLVGKIVGYTYTDLVNLMGEPTFNTGSDDGKTQKEWVIVDGDNVFTIYDWKTYDEHYTMNELTMWNVGGKGYAGEFIDKLESKLNASMAPEEFEELKFLYSEQRRMEHKGVKEYPKHLKLGVALSGQQQRDLDYYNSIKIRIKELV